MALRLESAWTIGNSGVFGNVEKEITLNWDQFTSLPHIKLDAEFHCVTQWSKLQNTWEGVAFNDVMKLVKPSSDSDACDGTLLRWIFDESRA